MSILIIDNYDSFTYNLVHLIQKLSDEPVTVKMNDEIDVDEAGKYMRILFSPGPGIPSEAGRMKEIIKAYAGRIPMLGVCLGHQAIAEVFGATLKNMETVYHGIASPVRLVKDDPFFTGISSEFLAGRYHSWTVEKPLPSGFEILAEDENGNVMAFVNASKKLYAIQFHPESILTPEGEKMVANWLSLY